MKATELRLNNYVTDVEDNDIYQIDKTWFAYLPKSINNIQPIPLTEQWLKDFGFEIGVSGKSTFAEIPEPNWFIMSKNDNEAVWNPYFLRSKGKCEYVHQLQNLYFCLTGKELTK